MLGFGFSGSGQNSAIVFTKLKDFRGAHRAEAACAGGRRRARCKTSSPSARPRSSRLLPPAIQGLGVSSGFSMYLVDTGGHGNDALDDGLASS